MSSATLRDAARDDFRLLFQIKQLSDSTLARRGRASARQHILESRFARFERHE